MEPLRSLTATMAIALLGMTYGQVARAEYPERPVTFVVPWAPGDLEDQLTRIIADTMTKETGKSAKVINRPGGGAVEGATYVAGATPDGYTIGILRHRRADDACHQECRTLQNATASSPSAFS